MNTDRQTYYINHRRKTMKLQMKAANTKLYFKYKRVSWFGNYNIHILFYLDYGDVVFLQQIFLYDLYFLRG